MLLSNRTSIPEVGGDCAFYFDPEDEDEFLKTMGNAADEPSAVNELRSRAIERAATFEWERAAAEVIALYTELGRRGGD
jgi:glycosyltransferase involved in cell wall biosynthesis